MVVASSTPGDEPDDRDRIGPQAVDARIAQASVVVLLTVLADGTLDVDTLHHQDRAALTPEQLARA